MSSIYVAVPSISDTEFLKTLKRCIKSSSYRNQVNIGAVGIYYDTEIEEIEAFNAFCKSNNIKNKILNRENDTGTGIARKHAMSMYDGEDYILQIDSHSIFMKNWDMYSIHKLDYIKKQKPEEKIIITAYPPEYKYFAKNKVAPVDGWNNHSISKFVDGSLISITNHKYGCDYCLEWEPFPLWVEEKTKSIHDAFIKNTKISGAYLFADKSLANHYEKLIPYNFAFFEEELIMSIEAYNLGWNFYAIQEGIPVAHLYIEDVNEFGGERSGLEESDLVKLNVKSNYINYCLSKNNLDKISKFEKYANANIMNNVLHYLKSNDILYNTNENPI